jgi:hypothetical protein
MYYTLFSASNQARVFQRRLFHGGAGRLFHGAVSVKEYLWEKLLHW